MINAIHVCVEGLKETLKVLIITHVTQVKRVKSGVCGFYTTLHTEYCYSFCYSMHVCVKGLEEALTVSIVTHVTQVKRVKSGVCSFYTTLHTEYCYSFCYSCRKGQKCQILCTVLCIQGLQEGSLFEPSVLGV